MTAAIEAEGLHKAYGDTQALKGVDLEVRAGTILGLLGPNGAGKTTVVRILTTLLTPDAGRASVAGLDVVRDAALLRGMIGLTGQYAALDDNLTGRENLVLVGRLHHMTRVAASQRAAELLSRFELTDAADRPVRTYSGGMRRRLDLGASLVNEPHILFLDEPTTGLDPRSRNMLWQTIRELVSDGTTVLLTTQYLEEADVLADRIAVIDLGQVIAEGTSDELKRRVGGDRIELHVADRGQLQLAASTVGDLGADAPVVDEPEGRISLPVSSGSSVLAAVVRRLDDASIPISDLALRRPTLDDVFLTLTGSAATETEEPPRPPRPARRSGATSRSAA